METLRRHMRQIVRLGRKYAASNLKCGDWSPVEMDAVRAVTFHGEMSQKSLGEHIACDKAAVTRIVTGLEIKGYIKRETDEKDKRVKKVCATDKAYALKNELIAYEINFYASIFGEENEEELAVFTGVLERAASRAKDPVDSSL